MVFHLALLALSVMHILTLLHLLFVRALKFICQLCQQGWFVLKSRYNVLRKEFAPLVNMASLRFGGWRRGKKEVLNYFVKSQNVYNDQELNADYSCM